MNVSQETINSIFEIVSRSFFINRKLDRIVSVLGVKFALNQIADKIHIGISHLVPIISDQVGERCLERYNITVEYGATPDGKEDFDSAMEIFQTVEDMILYYQNMFIGAMKIAFEKNDIHVFSDLSVILQEVNKIAEQVILLNDKAKSYGEGRLILMDSDIDKFWIL